MRGRELGLQQHVTAVGDQNKQRNRLEIARGLEVLDCVAQYGKSEGLCNVGLNHPKGLSRRSGNFRCSWFHCGSDYLGRHMGTKLPALLWERGALSHPAMLTAHRWWDGGVESPRLPGLVQKSLWFPPKEKVF